MKGSRTATLLPPMYVQRLVLAAAVHDTVEIDAITDELAERYPELVRPRAARGCFRSLAEDRRDAEARGAAS